MSIVGMMVFCIAFVCLVVGRMNSFQWRQLPRAVCCATLSSVHTVKASKNWGMLVICWEQCKVRCQCSLKWVCHNAYTASHDKFLLKQNTATSNKNRTKSECKLNLQRNTTPTETHKLAQDLLKKINVFSLINISHYCANACQLCQQCTF